MNDECRASAKRILLVDDDTATRESVKLLLGIDQHTVVEAKDGTEALYLFTGELFDLVITDYLMPDMRGDELAANIKNLAPAQPILMLSAYLEKLDQQGRFADAVLGKPFGVDELRRAVAQPFIKGARNSGHDTSFQTRFSTRSRPGSPAPLALSSSPSQPERGRVRDWGINE